jgi:hypothetical protein
MRRWMHTCYTLVTSEESQTLILKSLSSLRLLHSLVLQRCFSAEQMSKRALKEVEGMYLYTPQTNPTVTCQINKARIDRMRWSTWPDASVSAEWPDAPARDDRARPIMQEPNWTLTWRLTASDHRWPDASDHFIVASDYTFTLWNTCQTDHRVRSSQGSRPVDQLTTQWLVSTDQTCPVKTKTASGQG